MRSPLLGGCGVVLVRALIAILCCNGSRYSAPPFSSSPRRSVEVFPLLSGGVVLERPGVKGAPVFGAGKPTLDGEERSKRIE
jgi:hypothetical protein